MSKVNPIMDYYSAIEKNEIVCGRYIKLIYEYIVKGLESGLFLFDQDKADAAIEWIEEHCFHTEGPLAPGNLKLELWEKALIASVFGLVDENGNRQFREVLLVVARKNGKSLIASAIAKYIWLTEGHGAKVYCVAPKLDQADIIYDNVWQMVLCDPEYQAKMKLMEERDEHNKRIHDPSNVEKHRKSDLLMPATNSKVKKIAFNAKKSDGFNPSLAICDEIASWPGDQGLKQYEVMKSGMGARPEGLMLSCTTSGYEHDGIYDEILKRSTAFLEGTSEEKKLLPFLYIIDDPTKWDDIEELKKSNPNLGVSVSEDYLQEEIAVANGSFSKKTEFLTKYCNIKQNSSKAWMNSIDIEKAFSENHLNLDDFRGCYAVGGIDLSQTTDLTACTLLIQKEDKIYGFAKFFMPAERIDTMTQKDGVPYNAYVQRGLLKLSGENFVDYHDCYQWFVDLVEKYNIYPLKIGYDRYSAQYLVQDMNAYGFNMDDVYQGENLTPVIKESEGLLKNGAFEFGDNDLFKIHLFNSAMKVNSESNRERLVKIGQYNRIDGCAAFLDAMCVRQKWWEEIGLQLRNTRR